MNSFLENAKALASLPKKHLDTLTFAFCEGQTFESANLAACQLLQKTPMQSLVDFLSFMGVKIEADYSNQGNEGKNINSSNTGNDSGNDTGNDSGNDSGNDILKDTLPKIKEIKLIEPKELPDVMACLKCNIPVFLSGPAGSGKSTIGYMVAEKLGLEPYIVPVCQQTTKADLLGYNDAMGRYVPSPLRFAFENGGVFMLDEIDAANPNVLLIMNTVISSKFVIFPDGKVTKHEHFRVLAGANTIGTGNNTQYCGRNRIDAATLDRFAFIPVEYDEEREYAFAPLKKVCRAIQKIRHQAAEYGYNVIISPRQTINAGMLIKYQGMEFEKALDIQIFNNISDPVIVANLKKTPLNDILD